MEIWKNIKGYERRYKISSCGRIKSLSKMNRRGNEYCSPIKSKGGYLRVILTIGKKSKSFFIHRLVALSFIPNLNGKFFINHKNGIKNDNQVENLEWVTASENMKHAFNNNLCKIRKAVLQFNINGKLIKEFDGLRIAERETKINHCNISLCCSGKQKLAGGFIWKLK